MTKLPVPVYPLVAAIGCVLSGMTYAGYHALQSPDIVYNKSNPQPWKQVKPNETTKLYEPTRINTKQHKRNIWSTYRAQK